MNDFILGLVASYIKNLVKNPTRKRKLRHICLDIYQALKTAFADDPDFD